MSNVLLEASATGRPVITSDIPGCKEAVDPEISGLLIPAKDSTALANAMRKFLQLSPDARAQMGLAGRRKMEAEFPKEQIVAQSIQAMDLK